MMTESITTDFEERQTDIDLMCNILTRLQNDDEPYANPQQVVASDEVDRVVNILKSTILLMSYNQVESTLRGCVDAVYDHFDDHSLSYRNLSPVVQKTVLSGVFKKFENGAKFHDSTGSELELKIMRASLQVKKIFNGNIDRKKVGEIVNNYGVSISPPAECRDGSDLEFLKDVRNDLAHGNKTFSTRTSMETVRECVNKTERTSNFLRCVIQAFEQYIADENYLS